MQKENDTTEKKEKVLTKYDRKMEARRAAEEKERRTQAVMKWCTILLCAVIVVGTIAGIGTSIYKKQAALHNTYVQIGSHEVTKLEYDYYYQSIINEYQTTYASVIGMIGIDFSKDLSKQSYSEVMSWKDFFDKMTVDRLTEVKMLSDEAAEKGFTTDTAESYAAFRDSLTAGAEAAGITLAQYCKNVYGTYATPENIEPIVKENLLSAAYYEELIQQNTPGDNEITAYYEEHKEEYDNVSYRILPFKAELEAEASEDEVADALAVLSRTAEEMKEEIEAGGDFKELCREYAQEDIKADYTDTEKDASLKENETYLQINGAYGEWLFEEGRKEGDLTVVSDPSNRECYVVQFISREIRETARESIGSTLATETVRAHLDGLKEEYSMVNTAGKIEYPDKEEAQYAAEAQREAASETQSVQETQSVEETQGTEAAE